MLKKAQAQQPDTPRRGCRPGKRTTFLLLIVFALGLWKGLPWFNNFLHGINSARGQSAQVTVTNPQAQTTNPESVAPVVLTPTAVPATQSSNTPPDTSGGATTPTQPKSGGFFATIQKMIELANGGGASTTMTFGNTGNSPTTGQTLQSQGAQSAPPVSGQTSVGGGTCTCDLTENPYGCTGPKPTNACSVTTSTDHWFCSGQSTRGNHTCTEGQWR